MFTGHPLNLLGSKNVILDLSVDPITRVSV